MKITKTAVVSVVGRPNVGKSTLTNKLVGQKVAIVSSKPQTTRTRITGLLNKNGTQYVFLDTPGLHKPRTQLGDYMCKVVTDTVSEVDAAMLVVEPIANIGPAEESLIAQIKAHHMPAVLVINKSDLHPADEAFMTRMRAYGIPVVLTDAETKAGIADLRKAIIDLAANRIPKDRALVGDLVQAGDTVVLVTPIDTGAPKGRLILPQVQAIRELLDAHAKCLVVQQDRVAESIAELRHPPKLVMADSQVIMDVAAQTPEDIPLTTFSIQMAYSKADVIEMARGTAALASLEDGDRVLICETCSHHPQKDDIGRIKIPRWLRQKTGKDLQIEVAVGKDFPVDLTPYKVLIQCGGCVVTRRHMLMRLRAAHAQNVPMTNYGLTISYLQGVLERVLLCHPEALKAYRDALTK